jgi:hypothetical protein
MDVAYAVARAASEKFAGLGPKVSPTENKMIERVASAMQATKYKQ